MAGDMQGPGYVPPSPPLTSDSVVNNTAPDYAAESEDTSLENEYDSFLVWLLALIF